ncbi:hypothetical protein [Sphingobacterium endophyticum]|uniref:hypothetical protein n=1 Tax=Sphingobacterium endophyticum TaxID=2546448 RepID=UPI0018CF3527|nr:hypothetical protein [Sphingobacterium endophyticum]
MVYNKGDGTFKCTILPRIWQEYLLSLQDLVYLEGLFQFISMVNALWEGQAQPPDSISNYLKQREVASVFLAKSKKNEFVKDKFLKECFMVLRRDSKS